MRGLRRSLFNLLVLGVAAALAACAGSSDSGSSSGEQAPTISGAWTGDVDGEWNDTERFVLIFHPDGHYFLWCECAFAGDEDDEATPDHEIGMFTHDDAADTLTITEHLQNGGGGFDDPDDPDLIPPDPYSAALDGDTLTVDDPAFEAVFYRVGSADDNLIGAWSQEEDGAWNEDNRHVLVFFPNGYYFQWCDACGNESYADAEIGTYVYDNAANEISGITHVQNGRGGFDNESDDGPLEGTLTTEVDGSTLVFGGDAEGSFSRVE